LLLLRSLCPFRSCDRSRHSGIHSHLCDHLLQAFPADPVCCCNSFDIVVTLQLIFEFKQSPRHFPEEICLAFGRIHIILFLQHLQAEHESITRRMDPLLIFFCSKVLNEFIRIFIWIHPYNFSRNPGLPQDRHCAKCCSCTGFITVISQINFLDITLDQSCMPCCQCSPQ